MMAEAKKKKKEFLAAAVGTKCFFVYYRDH